MNLIQVHFEFEQDKTKYSPNEPLTCSYRLLGQDLSPVNAIETSVLWFTHGKGDEDIGVHFFKRLNAKEIGESGIASTHRLNMSLPKTPLTYHGSLINIEWRVRVKLFFKKAATDTFDFPFILGEVLRPHQLPSEDNIYDDSDDNASDNDENQSADQGNSESSSTKTS